MSLKISAGMDGIPTETIPNNPQEFVDWFKGVGIKRWFGPADIRNVLQGSGIEVTNNGFSSPPTIAISPEFQSLLNQPYVLFGPQVGDALTDFRSIAVQPLVLSLADAGALESLTIAVVDNGIGNAQLRQGAPFSVIGNPTNAIGNVQDLTQTQLTALVNLATSSLPGAIPALSGHSTDYLSGTGVFTALPSVVVPTAANPTASVGLSVVNGSATTYMRSDAAPQLSQAISPTMTGAWTFSPAGAGVVINAPASGAAAAISGVTNTSTVLIQSNATSSQNVTDVNIQRANGSSINTLGGGCGIGLQDTANSNATRVQNSGGQTEFWQANSSVFAQIMKFTVGGGIVVNKPTSGTGLDVSAAANAFAGIFRGSTTTGQSLGLDILAGTNSSDVAVQINNAANSVNYLVVWGDGGMTIGNPTGGNKGPGTLNVATSLWVNGVQVTVP